MPQHTPTQDTKLFDPPKKHLPFNILQLDYIRDLFDVDVPSFRFSGLCIRYIVIRKD